MDRQLLKFDDDAVDFNVGQLSKNEALIYLTKKLEIKNYVSDKYSQSIVNREKDYPTGLQFSDITVAIPHGDASFVYQSSMAIGICRPPIRFHDMGDIENEVNVDMIVLLAINDSTHHIDILNRLFNIFQNPVLAKELKAATSAEIIVSIIKDNLGE